ncbi:alpha/beta hydrolase [Limosilactobacillus secaliphilus]|nr:alpha/beta hydrolase [Limosilactobacillus secaliphilus]
MNMLKHKANAQQKKTYRLLIFTTIFLVLLAIPAYFWMQSSTRRAEQFKKSRMSPVIMVPGSSATKERFNTLVKMLNEDTKNKHSLLKLEVKNSGKITYSGKIRRGDREPIIVVGFENNHDGYNNIKKQAKMFDSAFNELSEEYKFNNFKAFGHSNGGLIWTYWLEHYYSDYKEHITIKRLMTVGSPYNFNETSTNNKTQMFSDFVDNRSKIPSNLSVISVIGTETYDSDGLVPEASVQAGKYIYQKQVKHFTTMTVTGEDAEHSDLPQNKQIVNLIEQYIMDYQNGKRNNPQNKPKN